MVKSINYIEILPEGRKRALLQFCWLLIELTFSSFVFSFVRIFDSLIIKYAETCELIE